MCYIPFYERTSNRRLLPRVFGRGRASDAVTFEETHPMCDDHSRHSGHEQHRHDGCNNQLQLPIGSGRSSHTTPALFIYV